VEGKRNVCKMETIILYLFVKSGIYTCLILLEICYFSPVNRFHFSATIVE
ncbi:MAG: hypothetical protein ACJASR_002156, partial [Psychroserpens sp.]